MTTPRPRRRSRSLHAPPSSPVETLVQAYRLIEHVQAPDAALDDVERLHRLALEHDWPDLMALTHWAQLLHARHRGGDAGTHLRAMLACAERTHDPALVALALSTSVLTEAIGSPTAPLQGTGNALTRAVVLLDEGGALAAHRCAAHIEVALAFHTRGLWELAAQHYDLADAAWPAEAAGPWLLVTQCQRRAIAVNRLDILIDWSCALAELDDWAQAAQRAGEALPQADAVADADFPAAWMGEVYSYRCLLAALAGRPRSAELDRAARLARQAGGLAGATVAMADAVRHHRAGQPDRAARRAVPVVDALGFPAPAQLRLLALRLAAGGHQTPAVARRYAEELVRLRWEARLARDRALCSAIEAERQQAEHRRLRHQVLTDDLTGLATRRAYHAYVSGLAQRPASARTASGQVAVMMIDVDHFKQVNDRFGHDVGDAVLRRLGAILASQVRAGDLAARLGGDEFVVLLDQVPAEAAQARADAILHAVSAHDWAELAPALTVSVSLGLCMSEPGEMQSVLARADGSLYEAKRAGRNRAVLATHAPEPSAADRRREP